MLKDLCRKVYQVVKFMKVKNPGKRRNQNEDLDDNKVRVSFQTFLARARS